MFLWRNVLVTHILKRVEYSRYRLTMMFGGPSIRGNMGVINDDTFLVVVGGNDKLVSDAVASNATLEARRRQDQGHNAACSPEGGRALPVGLISAR